MSKATVAEPPSNANEGAADSPPARQSNPPRDPRAATIKAPTNRLARQSPNDNHARAAMPVSHPDRRCLPIQIAALHEAFEADLKGNLYRIWNRMSSGSYFPPPVRAAPIPKKSGGQRILGVPTVSDRIAQMVVKQLIEPDLDPIFLHDSYGYRPGKSALDAVGVTRQRCWKYDWVLEFDIKGLFDNISHELLLKAVRRHVQCTWELLYIERWLTAPMEQDGKRIVRSRGTTQGGVISPILSNLFLHYTFDLWMKRAYPDLPWCRYADDGLVHCRTEQEAKVVKT